MRGGWEGEERGRRTGCCGEDDEARPVVLDQLSHAAEGCGVVMWKLDIYGFCLRYLEDSIGAVCMVFFSIAGNAMRQ